jgi:two-component system response regulator AtoC
VEKGLRPDLVLLDLLMPGIDGLQTLEQLRQLVPGMKVVMLSCVSDTRKVVQAIRLGAHDYLTKPFQKGELNTVIDQCLGKNQESFSGEVEELADEVFFVAASPAMRKIRSQAALVAGVDIPVLMLGESGTGKEVVARLIHKLSPRAHRTFLKVNCAAVPADLLESELFGYEAGAFTGANHAKPGKFELCNKGTILLDEIGDMGLPLQAKLLRVLQEREIRPVGSNESHSVDVRVIAATNRDLETAYREGTFRKDLYFRLNVVTVHLPSLRERRSDIPVLVHHFLNRYAPGSNLHVTPAAMKSLLQYEWPGNVRELENCVARAITLGDRQVIDVSDLPPAIRAEGGGAPQTTFSDGSSLSTTALAEMERMTILKVFEQANGDKALAGRMLGISRATLYRKLKRYNIAIRPNGESTPVASQT